MSGNDLSRLRWDLRTEFPNFEMRRKATSRLMKAIDVFLRIITFNQMKTFMKYFVTTLGDVVYTPAAWDEDMNDLAKIIVLRHERVHMRQRRRYGAFLYSLLYLFFPLPGGLAYFRMKFEREAYEETMRAVMDVVPRAADRLREPKFRQETIGHFTSAEYFWMWPFRRSMEKWFYSTLRKILAEREGPPQAA